jgi:Protein of unknown function (DUF1579)
MQFDPEPSPAIGPEHHRLDPFVGKWSVVGENRDGAPQSPNTAVTGEENYVWLPGGHFLLGHWDRRFDGGRHIGMNIIRYDATTHEYSSYNVDSLGFARTYRVTERDGVWSFAGDRERATIEIGKDGSTMTIDWELTKDGSTWLPLCHLEATKTT